MKRGKDCEDKTCDGIKSPGGYKIAMPTHQESPYVRFESGRIGNEVEPIRLVILSVIADNIDIFVIISSHPIKVGCLSSSNNGQKGGNRIRGEG